MLSILIKPVSSNCNLECGYCFYKSTAKENSNISREYMKVETLKNIVKKAFDYSKDGVVFAFQGGEPTLIGLDFFKELIKYQKKYNKRKILVKNSIQTNGYNIDEEFSKFLKKENFLVGLSLDGPKFLHDKYRVNLKENGSFDKVFNTKKIFDKDFVEYNILSVITKETSKNARELYKFYKDNDINFVQTIPCLDKGFNQSGEEKYSLTPDEYEGFLKEFFDLWYKDYKKGDFMSVRLFENICAMLLGMKPESCELMGFCSIQNVIEANGDIYPCDFYVSDDKRIGNINEISFKDVPKLKSSIKFIETKEPLDKCKKCKYGPLCKGGCKRYRDENTLEYYYCSTFKNFYDYSIDRFIEICKDIIKREKNR
ncbi:anaerobic sulfatase maturase [Clostridium sp. LY3-2]|uniref:anaerobic sulfatase maturase n=1 Tax=Clostridium sp. LY3-2 TaxID=2942482 RepID=UPI0021523F76|nr:anaerobic sulfatase maturase [Clostridium sp. LY3-2]MCR6514377.1 anaerobic sulfatase maturase [Clostridium sp. LY3-2]